MKNKSTDCVHAGQRRDNLGVVNAIEPSSAYQYIDGSDGGDQFYPRYFNTPNQQYIIEKVAALECAETGVIFGSGMAAIGTTLLAMLKTGDHAVLLENIYGGTLSFVDSEFPEFGIEYDVAGPSVDQLMASVKPNTRVIFLETPANPLMQVVDLVELAKAAAAKNIITIVDNTFASPINQNPIALGIDLVVHSGTKYLGGHSDLSFGAVVGQSETIERIRKKAVNYGGNLNAMTCYLIERSIKTLDVRVQRQNTNAMAVASFLDQHSGVDQVYYPGLANHPGHDIAASQMSGFGGMMAFDLAGQACPKSFLNELSVITPAMSLGGVESTVTMPIYTSHKPISPEERKRLGIGDRLVRLSVGIEGAEDIVSDLENALTAFSKQSTPEKCGV